MKSLVCAIFFMFMISCVQADQNAFHVVVEKNTKTLKLHETLQVILKLSYPKEYQPNLFLFLQNQKSDPQDQLQMPKDFSLVSYEISYSTEDSCVLKLKLKPKRAGLLYFVPSILSFSKGDGTLYELLVPGSSIECQAQATELSLSDLLPFYPESMISLSSENRQKIFGNKELQERERQKNLSLFGARTTFWITGILTILIIGMSILLLWFLTEFKDLLKKFAKQAPPRDLFKEFQELVGKTAPIASRSQELSSLLRDALSRKVLRELQGLSTRELLLLIKASQNFSYEEKGQLEQALTQLEAIEFAGRVVKEKDWAQVCSILSGFLEKASKILIPHK